MKLTLTPRSKVQIEATVSFPLEHGERTTTQTTEAYLFVPKSLAINVYTYPKYLFYRDLKTYSELLPKPQSLDEITSPGNGLLVSLKQSIDTTLAHGDEQALQHFETRSRSFCRIAGNAIDNHLQDILAHPDSEQARQSLEQYLSAIQRLIREFRILGDTLTEPCPQPELRRIFLLSDEHFSLQVEESACRLLDGLQHWQSRWREELAGKLHDLALGELRYRTDQGYTSVPSAKGHNEPLVYRRGALRTYADSVFFLTTRHKPEGRVAREVLLSMAAGIAMVFATAAAFLAHVQYENWTTTFFLVLVFSYMLKDRIKSLAQDYLRTKGQQLFFDFRTTIYGQVPHRALGVHRESFGFVPSAKLDPEILKLRDYDRLAALDYDYCGERVILYKRRTTLHPKRMINAFPECDIDGIREIIYFDLTRFARKMENTKSNVFITTEKGCRKETGRHVYHLHLVIKHQSKTEPEFRHFRIVMTRGGIRRIDTLSGISTAT